MTDTEERRKRVIEKIEKRLKEIDAAHGEESRPSSDTNWRKIADALYFAYINKNADCPHDFETDAIGKYKEALRAYDAAHSEEVEG